MVVAVTDKTIGTRGLSAFVVERGTPGFRPGKKENKLGLRASDTSELIFEDCELPAENLLGVEGQGFVDAMRILDGGRISIAALGLGMATGAYDCALRYSRQRKQFGRAISEFQAIQWKLADMATEIDAARLLTLRAAWLKDHHRKTTLESSMAKLYTSEVAVRVANEAVQIHGGYGFIKDYPAEKFYRDVKLCTIGEGTSEIQRLIIARQICPSNLDPHLRQKRADVGHLCVYAAGRKMANTLPLCPGRVLLRTRSQPPCRCTTSFTRESPRPLPPRPLVVKKGSKIFCRFSSAIPQPLSAMVSRTPCRCCPECSCAIDTRANNLPPRGMESAALSSRLENTWRSGPE